VYTAGCQIGCTTRFDNRLDEQWLFIQHGCQTDCQTGNRLSNRFDNLLYRVNGLIICKLQVFRLWVWLENAYSRSIFAGLGIWPRDGTGSPGHRSRISGSAILAWSGRVMGQYDRPVVWPCNSFFILYVKSMANSSSEQCMQDTERVRQ